MKRQKAALFIMTAGFTETPVPAIPQSALSVRAENAGILRIRPGGLTHEMQSNAQSFSKPLFNLPYI